jgi:3',5'-cyclic AMP phosphodiesterase CpdA
MGIRNFITRVLFVWCVFLLHEVSFGQFTFIQITDLHVADGSFNIYHHDNNGVKFQQVLNAANSLKPIPAFIVATGDISNVGEGGTMTGSEGMYNAITRHLFGTKTLFPLPGDYFIDSNKTIPIYFTPGNHDYYFRLFPDLATAPLYYYAKHISPDTDYCVIKDNAVILFVRSGSDLRRPLNVDKDFIKTECTGLTLAQCSWIRSTLQAYSAKRKIIVMHHPAVDANGTQADGTPVTIVTDTADGSMQQNRTMFLNICDSNNVDIVLCGHAHQNLVCNRQGKVVDNNWSQGTRYVQTAPCFRGCYRIITIDSGFVYVGIPQVATSINSKSNPAAFSPNINEAYFKPESLLILQKGIKIE